jgi:hypothetical protein
MAVLEGYARLTAAAAATAAAGGGQLPVDGVERMQHWSGVLVGGKLGMLQLMREDITAPWAGVDFEGPFLSLLFSLLRLAGSAVKIREAFGMQQVVCNVMYSAVDLLGCVSAPEGEVAESGFGVESGSGAAGVPHGGDVVCKLPCVVLFGRCCALLGRFVCGSGHHS